MRNKKNAILTIRLSSEELEQIKGKAKKLKLTLSEYVRLTAVDTPNN